MGKFENNRGAYPSGVGFTYTDADRDEVKVWKAGAGYPAGGIRIGSGSVYVPAEDLPRFMEELQRIIPKECDHCNGTGKA